MKTFRVINITNWTVEVFEIGMSPPYLAISHAWSDNIFPERMPLDPSSLGRKAIEQTILKKGFRSVNYCWVDRYCIIQDSEDDMNEQIPLMGQIFGNAKAVLIILTNELNLTQEQVDYGTSQLNDALPIWREESWTDQGLRQYWVFGEGRAKLVHAMEVLSRFTKAAWGTRVWTLQEYILATNVLWIGSDLEPISIKDELFVAIPGLYDHFDIAGHIGRGGPLDSSFEILFSHFTGMAAFRLGSNEQTRVMEMLGNRHALLPVDEVYGIMAASTVEISIQPKESRENTWKRWLEAALIAGHMRWLMLPPAMLLTKDALELTCESVPCSKRYELSISSGLDAVAPYGPVSISQGTVSLIARYIGPCTILRKLGPVHRCDKGWVHRGLTLIVFSKGVWSSAIDVAVAFGAGRYSNKQLIRIAQVLKSNYGRALRFIQRHMEQNFYPILQSARHDFVWADFMQLMSRSVMDTLNLSLGYLVRVKCPATQMSFLTVLATNGLRPQGDLVAFDCNATSQDRRHKLLICERSDTDLHRRASDASLIWHKAGITISVGEDFTFGWDDIPPEPINVGGSRCQVCKHTSTSDLISTQPLLSIPSFAKKDHARMIGKLFRKRRKHEMLEKITRKITGLRIDVRGLNHRRRHDILLRNLRHI